MLSVAEALARVTADLDPLPAEDVTLAEASGRVLAQDVAARLTQPPFAASAMDGYAVRRADVRNLPAKLSVIGEAAAGHPFQGEVAEGEAVRIFTGAPVPEGADLVVIQENAAPHDDRVEILALSAENFVRPAGGDFAEGDILLQAGTRLKPRDLLLAAQTNYATLQVRRRPMVTLLPSGDELVPPGTPPGPGQIISSIPAALAPIIRQAGGDASVTGIARDTMESLAARILDASGSDILLTIGGASVGEHDLMRRALEQAGYSIEFQNIAMRPGKPLLYGRRGTQRVVGVPGNPVSAVLCAALFLRPMIARLLGGPGAEIPTRTARLAAVLEANGPRQHYMRARIERIEDGVPVVSVLASQDSSLVSLLAAADCLIVRAPHAGRAEPGESVDIVDLDF